MIRSFGTVPGEIARAGKTMTGARQAGILLRSTALASTSALALLIGTLASVQAGGRITSGGGAGGGGEAWGLFMPGGAGGLGGGGGGAGESWSGGPGGAGGDGGKPGQISGIGNGGTAGQGGAAGSGNFPWGSAGGGGGGGSTPQGPQGTGGTGGTGGEGNWRPSSAVFMPAFGGDGTNGNDWAGGGGGGAALYLTDGGAFSLQSFLRGGKGGIGFGGGGGGAALVLQNFRDTFRNDTTQLLGGDGGIGSNGGGGGAGLFMVDGGNLNNGNSITGGAGGPSVDLAAQMPDTGGAGGTGVLANGGNHINRATIAGGAGSRGNFAGGAGGAGMQLYGDTYWGWSRTGISNEAGATITGGDGGATYRTAGRGGDGILFDNNPGNATISNSGVITGGNGGWYEVSVGVPSSRRGSGGAGIRITADGVSLNNAGTISGGLDGDDTTRANAVAITGNNNTLSIFKGAVFNGGIVAQGTGNKLVLKGSDAATFDLPGTIQGFERLEKQESGTWTLKGSSTQGWTVSGGTLKAGNAGALGTGMSYTVNGGTLDLGSFDASIASLSGDGGTTALGAASLSIVQNANSLYRGTLTGSGKLTKLGTGTLTLSGSNDYSGGTAIKAGALQIDNENALGGGTLLLEGGGLIGNFTGDLRNSMEFSSTDSVIAATSGHTLTLKGFTEFAVPMHFGKTGVDGKIILAPKGFNWANGFSALIDGGTLQVQGSNTAAALRQSSVVVAEGAVYDLNDQTDAGATTLSGGGTAVTGRNASTNISIAGGNFAGGITGAGNLHVTHLSGAPTGTLILSGTGLNTYAGNTQVFAAHTLKGGARNAFNANSATTVNSLGNLDLGGYDQEIGSLAGSGVVTNNGTSAATLTAGGDNTSTTFSGAIQDGTAKLGLKKVGSGTLSLSGMNSYSGGTTISSGVLEVMAAGVLGSGTVTLDGGTLRNGGSFGSFNNSFAINARGGTLDAGQGQFFISGNIVDGAGAGTLTIAGDAGGFVGFGGNNTYSGVTHISSNAKLAVSSSTALSANSDFIVDGELGMGGHSQTIRSLSGSGAVRGVNSFPTTLTIAMSSGSATFSGELFKNTVVPVSLVKSGAGTQIFTGTNTYAGDTIVQAGKLQFGVGNSGSINTLGGNIDVQGGELSIQTPSTVSVAGNVHFADNTTFSLRTGGGQPSLTAGSLNIGSGVAFNLSGIDSSSQANQVLIDSAAAIQGNFGTISVGGFNGTVDYLTVNTRKSTDGKQYLTSYDLSWTAGNNLAHGTFTLADAGNSFTVGADLADQTATAGWNGKTLTKQGDGTLILAGNNSYSGGTTIAGGTLQIGEGAASGSIAGDVSNDGTLAFNRSGTLAMAGTISGNGKVRQLGGGTVVLSGTNDYRGGTEILAGTLSVSSDANLGDASGGLGFSGGTLLSTASFDTIRAVTLQGAGRFDVAVNTSLGLSGTVSGNNDLVKAGSGTLKLGNGVNAYRNTLVEAGMLVGNASSISGNIGNAGAVVFDQAADGAFAGNIAALDGGKGTMVKRGGGKLTLTGNSALDWTLESGSLATAAARFGGNAAIGAGTSLTFDDHADASYTGTLSGSGTFAKTGSGTVKLTGDSSGFSGSTSIDNGVLSVDGKLGGAVDVLVGGRLQGKGTIGSLTVTAGSTVAPGNSIGTLNVAGDITLAAGSTYEVEIAGNGTSDRIAAGGKATVGGAKVAVTALDAQTSYQTGQTYTILTAGGGVSGSFDASVLSRSAFLDATLAQGANAVDLTIVVKKTEEPGQPGGKPVFIKAADTFNRTQTAGALDTLQQTGSSLALYNTLLMLSTDEARAAFDGLSGEINASTVTGLIENSQLIGSQINDRLRAAFETAGAKPLPLMGYGEDAKGMTTAPLVPAERYGAWGSAFGSWGSTGSDGNAGKLSRSTGGFVTGLDGFVTDDIRLGFLAGYSHSSFKGDDRRSSASSDNYHLGLYGGTQWGALSFRSGLAYTLSDIDSSRQVSFPGFADGLAGSYRAGTTQLFGELGYGIKAGTIAFEPFANLAYVNVHTNGFTETGGASALAVHGGSNDITFTTLGLRASTDFDIGSMKGTVRGMIGWRHGYGDVTPDISQAFSGSNAFSIAGAPIARDAAVIEAGLDFAITPEATLGISYHGQVGSKASDHGVRADLSVKF